MFNLCCSFNYDGCENGGPRHYYRIFFNLNSEMFVGIPAKDNNISRSGKLYQKNTIAESNNNTKRYNDTKH